MQGEPFCLKLSSDAHHLENELLKVAVQFNSSSFLVFHPKGGLTVFASFLCVHRLWELILRNWDQNLLQFTLLQ